MKPFKHSLFTNSVDASENIYSVSSKAEEFHTVPELSTVLLCTNLPQESFLNKGFQVFINQAILLFSNIVLVEGPLVASN